MPNVLEILKAWAAARGITGGSASSLQVDPNRLREALRAAELYASDAAERAAFVTIDPQSAQKLQTAVETIASINEEIASIADLVADIEAARQIFSAIKVLNAYRTRDQRGSVEAARAYGQLFVGIGHFADKLWPTKPYAQVLKNCGNFFVGIQAMVAPERRNTRHHFRYIEQGGDGSVDMTRRR